MAYLYDESYSIRAHVGSGIDEGDRDIAIYGVARPGDIGASENFKVHGRSQFVTYLGQWLKRLRTELQAIPINRLVEEQRHQIEELIGRFEKLPNEYFTREEAQALKERLDALEQQMVQAIVKDAINDEDVSVRISALEKDFAALEANVDTLKKPGWARSFAARVTRWMYDPDTRKLLADGVEITRKLLGP